MKSKHNPCRVLKFAAWALAFALTQVGLLAQTVAIPDQNLEAAIRDQLQKPEGDITVEDMESLTSLYAEGRGIGNLTGLEKASNVTDLDLGGNRISDLRPLAELTKLESLELDESKISDLSPLAELTNLTALFIRNTELSDLGPLAGSTNLTVLMLSNNAITDISPLAGLTNLEILSLNNNLITEIGPLAGLTNLRGFCGWGCVPGLGLVHNYIDINPGSPARQVIDSLSAIEGLLLVYELQNDPEPLMGGIPLAGQEDWYRADWWGHYSTAFAPWLFHSEHGFLYRHPESTNESMFLYDIGMETWCWTGEDVYPFIYAYNPGADNRGVNIVGAWLWYFRETRAPRSFGVVTGPSATQTLFFGP